MNKELDQYSEEQLAEMLEQKRKAKEAEKAKKKREYEKNKSAFIDCTVVSFRELAEELRKLKETTISRGTALHKEMYDVYEKEEKQQNQFSLESNDGKFKVVIESQDRQSFNEQAEVHINTIKDVLRDKFAARNKSMYAIIDGILMKNHKGDYDEKLVTKLNKHRENVDDARFNEALDELAKCYQTYESSTYVRVYEKDEVNKWKNVNIQFSSL